MRMIAVLRNAFGGYEVISYNRDPAVSDVSSLSELVGRLTAARTVWVMAPSNLASHLQI